MISLSLLIFSFCLFSFKVDLLGSIRADDLLVLLFFLLYTLRLKIAKPPAVSYFFFLTVFFYTVSSIYNFYIERVSLFYSLLFALRPVEYFLFFFLGAFLCKNKNEIDLIFRCYVIYALLLVFLQFNGIVGAFSGFSVDRAIANTGGPWELALVSAFMSFYFFREGNYLFLVLSILTLFLTDSRITIFSVLIVFIFYFLFSSNFRFKAKIVFFVLSVLFLLISVSFGLGGRLLSLSINDLFLRAFTAYQLSFPVRSSEEYFYLTYSDVALNNMLSGEGDGSANVRFTRWFFLIKTVFNDSISVFLGLGPSFAGKAVDGNYVRIFAESGFVGLFSYLVFFVTSFFYLKDLVIKMFLITLCVTALFIDSFVTYKAMFLFWFYVGFVEKKEYKI